MLARVWVLLCELLFVLFVTSLVSTASACSLECESRFIRKKEQPYLLDSSFLLVSYWLFLVGLELEQRGDFYVLTELIPTIRKFAMKLDDEVAIYFLRMELLD